MLAAIMLLCAQPVELPITWKLTTDVERREVCALYKRDAEKRTPPPWCDGYLK